MGNVSGSHLFARPDEIDWAKHAEAPWRSERVRELDRFGGWKRVSIPRGQSFDSRLIFLEDAVAAQGDNIEKELNKQWWEGKGNKSKAHRASWMMGENERISPAALGLPAPPAPAPLDKPKGKKGKAAAPEPELTELDLQLAATSDMSFSHGPMKPRPKPKQESSDAQKELLAQQLGQKIELVTVVNWKTGKRVQVAAWRLHMYAARRRIFLKVLTIIRFRRGLDSPLRMRRVDDFGFTIPSVLGPERFPRFVGDQLHLIQLRSQQKLLQSTFETLQKEMQVDLHLLLHQVTQPDFPSHLLESIGDEKPEDKTPKPVNQNQGGSVTKGEGSEGEQQEDDKEGGGKEGGNEGENENGEAAEGQERDSSGPALQTSKSGSAGKKLRRMSSTSMKGEPKTQKSGGGKVEKSASSKELGDIPEANGNQAGKEQAKPQPKNRRKSMKPSTASEKEGKEWAEAAAKRMGEQDKPNAATLAARAKEAAEKAASQEAHDSAKALKVLLSVEDLIEGRDEIALRSGSRLASRASPALRALLNLPTEEGSSELPEQHADTGKEYLKNMISGGSSLAINAGSLPLPPGAMEFSSDGRPAPSTSKSGVKDSKESALLTKDHNPLEARPGSSSGQPRLQPLAASGQADSKTFSPRPPDASHSHQQQPGHQPRLQVPHDFQQPPLHQNGINHADPFVQVFGTAPRLLPAARAQQQQQQQQSRMWQPAGQATNAQPAKKAVQPINPYLAQMSTSQFTLPVNGRQGHGRSNIVGNRPQSMQTPTTSSSSTFLPMIDRHGAGPSEPRPLYPPGGAEDPHAPAKPMLSLLSNLSQNVAARAKSGRNNINIGRNANGALEVDALSNDQNGRTLAKSMSNKGQTAIAGVSATNNNMAALLNRGSRRPPQVNRRDFLLGGDAPPGHEPFGGAVDALRNEEDRGTQNARRASWPKLHVSGPTVRANLGLNNKDEPMSEDEEMQKYLQKMARATDSKWSANRNALTDGEPTVPRVKSGGRNQLPKYKKGAVAEAQESESRDPAAFFVLHPAAGPVAEAQEWDDPAAYSVIHQAAGPVAQESDPAAYHVLQPSEAQETDPAAYHVLHPAGPIAEAHEKEPPAPALARRPSLKAGGGTLSSSLKAGKAGGNTTSKMRPQQLHDPEREGKWLEGEASPSQRAPPQSGTGAKVAQPPQGTAPHQPSPLRFAPLSKKGSAFASTSAQEAASRRTEDGRPQSRMDKKEEDEEDPLNEEDAAALARIGQIKVKQNTKAQAELAKVRWDVQDSDALRARRKPAVVETRTEQLQKLAKQLQACSDTLAAVEHRQMMYINRANSAWADEHRWMPPDIWGAEEMTTWKRSVEASSYRDAALNCIKTGQVAFIFNAFEDSIDVGVGPQNMWVTDPWQLYLQYSNGTVPEEVSRPSAKVNQAMWGGRAIAALVQSISAAAGPIFAQAAVNQAWVIIALDDQTEQQVVKDLWMRKFYGLNRERVLFVMQTRRPCYVYDTHRVSYVPDEQSSLSPPGTGLTFMQMAWSCEAYKLGEDGVPAAVQGTVMEALFENNVKWMLSRRARDLGIISDAGAFSIDSLAYTIFMREKARAGAVAEVSMESGDSCMNTSRIMDSIVLSDKSMHVAWRKSLKPSLLDELPLSGMKQVMELSHVELQGGGGYPALKNLRVAMKNSVAVGCGRYAYHVPTLKSVLTTPALFRPKLNLMANGERLGLQVDARDLMSNPTIRCMGMLAGRFEWRGSMQGGALLPQAMDVLLQLLQEQDTSPVLRLAVPGMQSPLSLINPDSDGDDEEAEQGSPETRYPSARRKSIGARSDRRKSMMVELPQQTIVVFVANNRVSQLAVDIAIALALPGRDTLRLVNFIASDHPDVKTEAEELMSRLYRSMLRTYGGGAGLGRTNSPAVVDTVLRGESALVDCMENYLDQHNATMAVIGSDKITQGSAPGSVIGSVALSLLRRVSQPVVLVTNNSFKLVSPKSEASKLGESDSIIRQNEDNSLSLGPKLKLGVLVEPTAAHLHNFMIQKVASKERKDEIALLQHMHSDLTVAKLNQMRRVLGQFQSSTSVCGLPVFKTMQVEGLLHTEVPNTAEQIGVNVLGVALPGHNLPVHIISLMRTFKGAVMVHRSQGGETQALGRVRTA